MKLENWSIRVLDNPYLAPELETPRLAGAVFGHPNFEDGDPIVTSPIESFDGMRVITRSGSHYELGEVNPDYEAQYPDAKNRLIASLTKDSG